MTKRRKPSYLGSLSEVDTSMWSVIKLLGWRAIPLYVLFAQKYIRYVIKYRELP